MSDRLSEPMTEARLQEIEDLPWVPPLTVIVAELLQEVKRLRSLLRGRPVAEAPVDTPVLVYDNGFLVATQSTLTGWRSTGWATIGDNVEPDYWWPLPEVPR